MEIRDYLSVARRWMWFLLLVPPLVGGAMAALVVTQPTQYRGVATVAIPNVVAGLDSEFAGQNGNRSFVSNLTAVVESQALAEAVAKTSRVPSQEIRSGLSATAIGESSLIKIVYLTPHREDAVKIAGAAGSEALRFVFGPPVERAADAVEAAETNVGASRAALGAFAARTGMIDPEREYQIKAQQITGLEQGAIEARAVGETTAAYRLGASAATEREALAAMSPAIAEYQGLKDSHASALSDLEAARTRLTASADRLASVETPAAVTAAPLKTLSPTMEAAQKGIAADAASAFLLVLALAAVGSIELGVRPIPSPERGPRGGLATTGAAPGN